MSKPLPTVSSVPQSPFWGVLRLAGPIDAKNVAELEAALLTSPGSGFRNLVLDLAEVRYINSAGLSYLVILSDRVGARGGTLELASPQPKVKVLLDLMGLGALLRVHKTVEAALGFLERQALKIRPRPSAGTRPRSTLAARPGP